MADLAWVKEQGMWINLDYVVRIESDGDDAGSTLVVFADGTSFSISPADGKRLVRQLRPKPKKKKKKKKKETASEAAGVEEQLATPADL